MAWRGTGFHGCVVFAACGLAAGCAPGPATVDDRPVLLPDGGTRDAPLVTVILTVPDLAPPPPPDLAPPAFVGGFIDVTAPFEAALDGGVGDGRMPTSLFTDGVLADLDGDGIDELILDSQMEQAIACRYDPVRKTLALAPDLVPPMMRVFAALDLDGDGRVDLLGADNWHPVAWGGANGLTPATTLNPASPYPPTVIELYWGGAVDDVDGDGWLDLVLGEQAGCNGPNPAADVHVLLRSDLRVFRERPGLLPLSAVLDVNAVLATPLAPGLHVIAALGAPCDFSTAATFFRETGRDAAGYPTFAPFEPLAPAAYALQGATSFGQTTPMAAALGDLHGDGALELLAPVDPLHAVMGALAAGPPFADLTHAAGFAKLPSDNGHPMLAWGTALLDLDRDGLPDVLFAHGNDARPVDEIGPQHVSALWNAGGLAFADVTDALGLGLRGQYRSLAVGDLEGDGDPDLVVGSKDSGLARLYRDDVGGPNNGLALRLHGTSSNHLGVGARVVVAPDGPAPPQTFVVGATASPRLISEPLVFAGLGGASTASATITWPSGTVQQVAGLAAGRVNDVTEPPVLAIDPASRHLPADGRSTATITITPRAPDGTLRPASSVTATLLAGGGTLVAPAQGNGAWTATLTAPSTIGSTVIEVAIDGTPVGVRPRIFWDPQ